MWLDCKASGPGKPWLFHRRLGGDSEREARRIGVWIGAGLRPRLQLKTAAKRKRLCSSERDHSEAGDGPEVFHVDRGDIEAQMQGRSADEQVWEVVSY